MIDQPPALKMLMMGYLHQDYRLIGDVQANVDEFVVEHPELAPLLPAEVSQVLAQLDEEQTKALIVRLGAEIQPSDGGTYREWLTRIADRVRGAT